ncbi:MAG: bifunctional sugar-1-phosphate nucleotidylyltransferase/acetyltransferase [Candidatus Thermoplasmatota archaeon]|nr:bifunctional sugar-1-phosphate nucleotidylyltransferase/acetyltransferase [Candidatus Thermoplasmatota archaeon]
MITEALILAAGKGTRMWPLTENLPKPLLPLCGKPIIEHQIRALKNVGVKKINILIGHRMKEISDLLGNGKKYDVKINYIVQSEQKGTGHAVSLAEKHIKNSFFCINGDTLVDEKNIALLAKKKTEMAMMVTNVDDGRNFGVVKSKNGLLTEIIEKGFSGKSSINAGIYLFNKKIFKSLKTIKKSIRGELELTDALILNKIYTIEYVGFWKDIGSPWDLLTANEVLIDSIENKIKGNIEDNVNVNGHIYLGKNSTIKSGTYIEGPLWIGDNCTIGPNAYLRKGTVLCGKNKVGAASEIKNSILFEGAKAPHHNYVGDSILGKHCNLGSGTKVANLRLDKKEINVSHKGKRVNTGRKKLGVIMGDNISTGINSSINSGTIIGNDTNIGPNALVSGTYESKSLII